MYQFCKLFFWKMPGFEISLSQFSLLQCHSRTSLSHVEKVHGTPLPSFGRSIFEWSRETYWPRAKLNSFWFRPPWTVATRSNYFLKSNKYHCKRLTAEENRKCCGIREQKLEATFKRDEMQQWLTRTSWSTSFQKKLCKHQGRKSWREPWLRVKSKPYLLLQSW